MPATGQGSDASGDNPTNLSDDDLFQSSQGSDIVLAQPEKAPQEPTAGNPDDVLDRLLDATEGKFF